MHLLTGGKERGEGEGYSLQSKIISGSVAVTADGGKERVRIIHC
jgi:hypothetical protein